MNRVRTQRIAIIGACASLALASGAAFAQQEGKSDYSQPLTKSRNRDVGGGSNQSRTVIRSDDGDQSYEVTIAEGEMEAKVNGKKVPAERIRRSKDKVEILDKEGNVLKSFDVSMTEGSWRGGVGRTTMRPGQPQPPKPPKSPDAIEMPQPRIMIGITMSEPSEALAEHLGIKQDEAVVVEHVYEGLPAEKSGLKVQDVIVEVDGVRPLDQKKFRETINKKNPGQKIHLKVLRKGEEQKIAIEVQEFDAEKFAAAKGEGPDVLWRTVPGDWDKNFQMKPEQMEAFREAMKGAEHGRAFVWGAGPGEEFKFAPYSGVDAKRLEEMQSQIDRKIADLDEKLAKINEQMERLEKLISKLGERGGTR